MADSDGVGALEAALIALVECRERLLELRSKVTHPALHSDKVILGGYAEMLIIMEGQLRNGLCADGKPPPKEVE